ncbi:MAG: NnrS family protein [Fimbriimonadaceae bacterium]
MARRSAEVGEAPVSIFRPFFFAGIATALTVGCLLGALALLGISREGSYSGGNWTPYVLAHANSQLFGWVGFFVMGFTLQQHGASSLSRRNFLMLAHSCLYVMASGIALRFIAEPLAQADPNRWTWLGIASSVLQIVAVGLLGVNITANRDRSRSSSGWPSLFVVTALVFWAAVTLVDPFVFVATHQGDKDAALAFVAEWATPIREAQFLGFAATMVFGVAASKFPGCLGFQPAVRLWGIAGYAAWVMGLVLRLVGWGTYFRSGLEPSSDTVFRLGSILLWLGVVLVFHSLRLFEPVIRPNASQKFLKAGFAWLLVATTMASLERLHLSAVHLPFSHAFTGAVRHAVTVGFISQMIMGVGFHVASRMSSAGEVGTKALWAAWWLVNIGNAGRVFLELATDYSPGAFAPMGATGFIELVGLGLWAAVMVGQLSRKLSGAVTSC